MTTTSQKPVALTVRTSSLTWMRRNMFRTPMDSTLTLVLGSLALYVVYRVSMFAFVNGRWEIVGTNLKLLLVGRWPVEHLLRIAVAVVTLALWGGSIVGIVIGNQIRHGMLAAGRVARPRQAVNIVRRFGLVIAMLVLLLVLTETVGPWIMGAALIVASVVGLKVGRWIGVKPVPSWPRRLLVVALVVGPIVVYLYLIDAVPLADWEGFMFNIAAAVAGIILCFPLGVLLALGRRSKLPVLRALSVLYIELVRGSPLYVLLLMANVSLEFFVPAALAPSKVTRAVVTFTLFTAAYLAEIVRGGLQSVPRGQEEAAKALGLTPFKQISLIVLPQALRNVIPAQIGQFISLFKDTVLAGFALGILDLLSAAQASTQQPDFSGQGLIIESLAFVALLFWVGSFTMSRESQRLEGRLGVGTR